jgi:prophage regulatory protein
MNSTTASPIKILRPKELAEMLSISKPTLWRMEKKGELPKRKKLSDTGRAVGWLQSDIKEWLDDRPDADPISDRKLDSEPQKTSA